MTKPNSGQSNSNLGISTDTKANCPNCQSDDDTVASTINNTCPLCGRTLDKNLRGIDESPKAVDYSKPVEPIVTADNVIIGYKNAKEEPANNPEDLWDWCCTEVYQLDNGEDVWKQINKVHQLALKEQREKEMCRLVKILNKMKWKNIRKTMLLSYRNGSLGFHTGSGFDHHELTIGTLEEYGNYHYNEAISDVLQLLKEK